MQRTSRWFGCGSVLLALILLAGILAWQGQKAFSPGPLSAQRVRGRPLGGARHHADLEDQCQACHRPLQLQADLCTQCHEDIRAEWQSQGLHARVQEPNHCRRCHPDHRGRNFDMLEPARQALNHDRATDFALSRHFVDFDLRPLSCEACHPTWPVDAVEPIEQRCHDCHQRGQPDFMARHTQEFPGSCLACHDGTDRMADFDHARVFPLEGAHGDLECTACHQNFRFRGTPRECASCHEEPALHRGLFGQQCHYCHTPAGWRPALLRMHHFPLDHGAPGPSSCNLCHPNNRYPEYTCYGCHAHTPEETRNQHRDVEVSATELLRCASCHPFGRRSP